MDLLAGLERVLSSVGFRGDLHGSLLLYGLVLARLAAAISLSPFLGGQSVPMRMRLGLAAVITAILVPSMPPAGSVTAIDAVALLAKEILLGSIIGFLAQAVFYGIEMAGALIDTQRGMNQITLYTPQLPGPASVLGLLQVQAAIALFFTFDGHLYFLRALADSFTAVPAAKFPSLAAGGLALAELVMRVSAQLFVVAIRLSAPVLLALFLLDVCFGLFNRVAAQIPIHSENQTVKALVSLLILVLIMPILAGQLREYPQALFRQIADLVAGFR